MTALLIALVSAIVSAGITWLLGSSDRAQAKKSLEAQQAAADAQKKIAELEAERAKRDFFLQFSPKTHFHFSPPPIGNVLRLEATEPFTVDSIHYLNGSSARVGSEEICKAGTSIQIPISDDYINKVQQVGPLHNHYDGSAPMQFRLVIRKDGMSKEILLSAVIKLELIQTTPGQLWVRKLVG
jgi:type II secretory pathway pseudopilin PulG